MNESSCIIYHTGHNSISFKIRKLRAATPFSGETLKQIHILSIQYSQQTLSV